MLALESAVGALVEDPKLAHWLNDWIASPQPWARIPVAELWPQPTRSQHHARAATSHDIHL